MTDRVVPTVERRRRRRLLPYREVAPAPAPPPPPLEEYWEDDDADQYLDADQEDGTDSDEGEVHRGPDYAEYTRLGITRDVYRSRRRREVRATTISVRRMPKRDLALGAALYPERDYWKPLHRSECFGVPRPCPYVSCRYNLFLDVSPRTGTIKLNFPDLEPNQMGESCALDVADRGGIRLEDAGVVLNMTRERVRQIETTALGRIEAVARRELADFVPVDLGGNGRRRLPVVSTGVGERAVLDQVEREAQHV